jgi:deoxyribodipyrimidine photo-lyase
MSTFNDARVRHLNDRPARPRGKYVLYWCQMFRRLTHNHALDYAVHLAKHLKKPLVVYEALKLNYPWANARIHTVMLEGMKDTAATAKRMGVTYWPFVETPEDAGRGLVKQLAADAAALVTDDYPAYIVPAHNRAIASLDVPVYAVDSNGIVPLSLLGKSVAAAAHLRPRLHKLFAEGWANRALAEPDFTGLKAMLDPPFEPWTPPKDVTAYVKALPIDQSVPAVAAEPGGGTAGRERLAEFLKHKLPRYAEERNQPDDPAKNSASRLSTPLHFGHISIEEVIAGALATTGDWSPTLINSQARGRDDFFCRDPNVNSFLDEAITWRDVGHHWHHCRNSELGTRNSERKNQSWQSDPRPTFNFETMDFSPLTKGTLETVLPAWALTTLTKHARDRREFVYTLEQFENAATHDELWNAAQTELVLTGRIHNYLRMLWAKKVLEWSPSPEEAYRVLEHLNNKYAIDGRDPNSYTGILWTFGLFDRPWPPERDVFGSIRYMSSENTAKKFRLKNYFDYIAALKHGPKPTLFSGSE